MMTSMLIQALVETLYMTGVATLLAHVAGIPLGVALVVTDRDHVLPNRAVHELLAAVVNVGRSVPFIILLVAIIPFTRWVVGTSIGTSAAMVPLTVAAIPFVARLVDTALREVEPGVIEAAQAMGATPWQIIARVLLPESLPSLMLGAAITAISVVGYSAMAGAVGGGGLGDLAVRYGYQRFRTDVMIQTVVILVALVQGIQVAGEWAARHLSRR